MSGAKIEVIEDGVLELRPTPDQLTAWSRSAEDQPLDEWVKDAADKAAVALAYDERTWPVIIDLKHPIEFAKQRITQLELRRGKLGDIKGIKLGGEVPIDHLILIASKMTGQVTQVIERLDAEDSGEVMSIVLDFYARCLATGKKR